jgi:hypothetical protein
VFESLEEIDETDEIEYIEELEDAEEPEEIASLEDFEFPVIMPENTFDEDESTGLIELCSAEFATSFLVNPDLFFPVAGTIDLDDGNTVIPDIIVEQDGLYTIPKRAQLSFVEQNSEFKMLVDSLMTDS